MIDLKKRIIYVLKANQIKEQHTTKWDHTIVTYGFELEALYEYH